MYLETKPFNITKNYLPYKEQSGIYALLYQDEVIYVGQSINIYRRLLAHHSAVKRETKAFYVFLREHIDEISFLVLPIERDLLNQKEEHYINKYKPRFNRSGVIYKYKPLQRYVW